MWTLGRLTMFLAYVYFFVIVVAVVTSQWVAFSPEETLFSYTRCAEDNFGNDYILMAKWMNWELPQDEKSACYAKCVLVKLELFDGKTKSFKADHILEQYEKYKQYTGQDEQGVKEFVEAVKGLGTTESADCSKVAQAYAPVFEKFKDVLRNVYFGKKEITDKIYEADTTVKKRDETIFRFCEKKNFENGKVTSCTLRKTGITMSNTHLDCLYRGMRYLDRSGNIDPEEVKRDLHHVGVKDKDSEVDQALNNCKVKEESKASDYNDCLWKNPSLRNHLTSALDYREVRSESYRYFLTGPKPYDVDDVKAKVLKYDQDAGCT